MSDAGGQEPRASGAEGQSPQSQGLHEPRRRPPPRRRLSGRAQRRLLFGGVAGVVLVVLIVLLFQPFHGEGGERVRIVIPPKSSVGEIADLLDGQEIVSSGFLFTIRATISGRRSDLKPGVYTLRRDTSYGDALDALAKGPPRNIINILIPEGLSRPEIARVAGQAGVTGDYLAASKRSPILRPSRYGATGGNHTLEGFLFPATYQLKRGATAKDLVGKELVAFKENFAGVNLSYARKKNLTPYDVLTIASMIEREAQLDRERPLIAAVIYNRLRKRIPLGIDATTRFAVGNWTKPLTASQLATGSPYNTRNRAGLPPGPIGNPGLASIQAAARPARVKYLYYVVKPGTCGEHAFSSTGAQFQADQRRYEQAREAAGKSPTNCP